MRLQDKVVLITGAGTGIGAASARMMASEGAAVVLAGIDSGPLASVATELTDAGYSALAVTTDVTREADIERAVAASVETFGRLDVVVANAGIQRHRADRDLPTLAEDEWDLTQNVNLRGVYRTCKHGLRQLIEQGDGGSIVIVSSITAISGLSANVSYMTAKAGLLGFNRHIAVHYAQYGIRSNAICPGALEQTPDWADHPNPERRKEMMEQDIPLGRLGRSEDIAPFVTFLASDESSYANGANFVVDGGLTIR
ncbi:MAG: SDR family oxidoreductase [Pseudomonadota bacterium]